MVMMLTVMFALYSIFDMSLRVFSYGNNKTEAVENARLGLEKMEREIRAAQNDDLVLDEWTKDTISFKHKGTEGPKQITYSVYPRKDDYALGRKISDDNNEAVVEYVDYQGTDDPGLNFEYLNKNMGNVNAISGSESQIAIVRMTLEVKPPGENSGSQTLTTSVHLRNQSSDG
jgi:hypothetical protein